MISKPTDFNNYIGYVIANDYTRYYNSLFEQDVIHKTR